ncbi:membrane-bound alkaline phosphatase-like [Epargyreus clarus]|uniref:membrane-bound alkaline phosphatase-like n=1 Tax=Epargyreus clarus TaxID=520877 RepID=UPI003C2ADD26
MGSAHSQSTPNMLSSLAAVTLLLCCGQLAAGDRYHPEVKAKLRADRPTPAQAERTAAFWYNEARSAIEGQLGHRLGGGGGKARNVVLFMGDGMSVPTLAAARTLLGQRNGRTGEEAQLSFESFPSLGLTKTYCVNAQTADSACTATAYLCGVKTNSGTIGVTAAVPRRDCAASLDKSTNVESIAAWALADGRDAGIVTTTRITHASPAGAFAKVANRHWESDSDVRGDSQDPNVCPDIAYQMINSYPGNEFKVLFGGGRREFLPTDVVDEEGTRGRRTDGRNLINEWQNDKRSRNVSYQYVWNRNQLISANVSLPDYMLGLFESSHMQYNMEADLVTEPTLEELTEVAIRSLSRNEKGFFLFVEGGRIDHAHHDNLVELALDETIEFSKAIGRATELLSEEDSLIVVTSDHAHVMSFNGYTTRGGDVLGVSDSRDRHGRPYMTLSYTNGPGFRPHVNGMRVDVTAEQGFGELDWRSHVDVPLASETHGADDVAVFARGPHHALFTGMFEQSGVPHRMAYAACIGPGLHACSAAARPALAASFALLFAMLLLLR